MWFKGRRGLVWWHFAKWTLATRFLEAWSLSRYALISWGQRLHMNHNSQSEFLSIRPVLPWTHPHLPLGQNASCLREVFLKGIQIENCDFIEAFSLFPLGTYLYTKQKSRILLVEVLRLQINHISPVWISFYQTHPSVDSFKRYCLLMFKGLSKQTRPDLVKSTFANQSQFSI